LPGRMICKRESSRQIQQMWREFILHCILR
jgi:hypothetical protein